METEALIHKSSLAIWRKTSTPTEHIRQEMMILGSNGEQENAPDQAWE